MSSEQLGLPGNRLRTGVAGAILAAGTLILTACGGGGPSAEARPTDSTIETTVDTGADSTIVTTSPVRPATTTEAAPKGNSGNSVDTTENTDNEPTTTLSDDDVEDEIDTGDTSNVPENDYSTLPDVLREIAPHGYPAFVIADYQIDNPNSEEQGLAVVQAVAHDLLAVNNTKDFDQFAQMFGFETSDEHPDQAGVALTQDIFETTIVAYAGFDPEHDESGLDSCESIGDDLVHCSGYIKMPRFTRVPATDKIVPNDIAAAEKGNFTPTNVPALYLKLDFVVDTSRDVLSAQHDFSFRILGQRPEA